MRFTLKDDGYSFKKIMQGRKWVGRVWFNKLDNMYTGKIGQTEHRDVSWVTAFEGAVAKHLGHEDVVALKMHNANVRAANRAAKQHAQYAMDQIMRGNFKPLDELFGIKD